MQTVNMAEYVALGHLMRLLLVSFFLMHVFYNTAINGDYGGQTAYHYSIYSLPCKLFNRTILDCTYRNLSTIPPLPPNITTLNMSCNKLQNITESDFTNQNVLEIILLDQQPTLKDIKGSPFAGLPTKTLNLSNAGLTSLASRCLRGLYHLQVLLLQENSLHTLPVDVFCDLASLLFLDLSLNPLTAIPDIALSKLHQLETLVLWRNAFSLINLGQGFANLTKLTSLTLFSLFRPDENCTNNRHIIANDTFKNIANSPITHLRLKWYTYGVKVTTEAGFLKPLKHVESMRISPDVRLAFPYFDSSLKSLQTKIYLDKKRLTNVSLHRMAKWKSSLTHLNIQLSGINGIEGYAFVEFINLRVLNINGEKYALQFISDNAFYGLKYLEELYLSRNKINKLPTKAFKAFMSTGSLRLLDLSYNGLTGYFPDDAFTSISSLTHLNFSHNPIAIVGAWLHKLTNLKDLKFSYETIYKYGPNFSYRTISLPSLERFYLDHPADERVFFHFRSVFWAEKMPNLQQLHMAECNIYNIKMIENLRDLEYFDGSGSFAAMHNFGALWGQFIRMSNLTNLLLASNNLYSITEMRFNESTPHLQVLNLRQNHLRSMNEGSFYSLKNLQNLDLTDNQLLSLDGLQHFTKIKILRLSRNSISLVPSIFLQAFNSSGLHFFDISANPFSCTCSLEPFRKWILSDTNVLISLNSLYQCDNPKKFKGLSISYVELDCQSHVLYYIGIGVPNLVVCFILVGLVINYRWHLKYACFLLCHRRQRYQPQENTNDDDDDDENVPLNMLNRTRYDAFVSYAHDSDKDLNFVVNDLRENIERGKEPLRLCIGHARDFIPGTPLLESITEAIHNRRKTIIVLSPSYLESEWCYFETQHAWLRLLNEGKDVIILILLESIPDNKMTMWLRQFLCKKGFLRWPPGRAGQDLFFRCLRELIKTPSAVDRRYDV